MLNYKFIPISEYESGNPDAPTEYKIKYPYAPISPDGTEVLLCGEPDLNEEQMNQHKLECGWIVADADSDS